MRKHERLFLRITILLLAECFMFTACSSSVHVHTYEKEWSRDAEYHWHEPTCFDIEAKKEKHKFKNGKCSQCGYKDPASPNS